MTTAAPVSPAVETSGEPDGLACDTSGAGEPVTLAAHGLGGSVAETRPLLSRASGTRVLLHFRGHGDSPALDGGWDYDGLADDLLAVADARGATQALGVSLGAGALLRAAVRVPGRFRRLVLVLPATVARTRDDDEPAVVRLRALGRAIDAGDVASVTDLLLSEVPADLRDRRAVHVLLGRQAADLVRRPAPVPLRAEEPLDSWDLLAEVTCPVLVVGQADDRLHPLPLARELAAALPRGRLLEVGHGGVWWADQRRVQDAVADFLGGRAHDDDADDADDADGERRGDSG